MVNENTFAWRRMSNASHPKCLKPANSSWTAQAGQMAGKSFAKTTSSSSVLTKQLCFSKRKMTVEFTSSAKLASLQFVMLLDSVKLVEGSNAKRRLRRTLRSASRELPGEFFIVLPEFRPASRTELPLRISCRETLESNSSLPLGFPDPPGA